MEELSIEIDDLGDSFYTLKEAIREANQIKLVELFLKYGEENVRNYLNVKTSYPGEIRLKKRIGD